MPLNAGADDRQELKILLRGTVTNDGDLHRVPNVLGAGGLKQRSGVRVAGIVATGVGETAGEALIGGLPVQERCVGGDRAGAPDR